MDDFASLGRARVAESSAERVAGAVERIPAGEAVAFTPQFIAVRRDAVESVGIEEGSGRYTPRTADP
jgi:hypothetical protein